VAGGLLEDYEVQQGALAPLPHHGEFVEQGHPVWAWQIFNDNLEGLRVLESKRNATRKGLVYELLNTQDAVLCSYFAQRLTPCLGLGDLQRESGVTVKT
jgi:hypothetical protein